MLFLHLIEASGSANDEGDLAAVRRQLDVGQTTKTDNFFCRRGVLPLRDGGRVKQEKKQKAQTAAVIGFHFSRFT
jgi:hypothetical protein